MGLDSCRDAICRYVTPGSIEMIFSICRSEMGHLVCVSLYEGRAGRGARNIASTGRVLCQPIESIDEAQHIRHEYVGDGKRSG